MYNESSFIKAIEKNKDVLALAKSQNQIGSDATKSYQ